MISYMISYSARFQMDVRTGRVRSCPVTARLSAAYPEFRSESFRVIPSRSESAGRLFVSEAASHPRASNRSRHLVTVVTATVRLGPARAVTPRALLHALGPGEARTKPAVKPPQAARGYPCAWFQQEPLAAPGRGLAAGSSRPGCFWRHPGVAWAAPGPSPVPVPPHRVDVD
jgi:hypothetical protein